jgi:hypothetical protein
MGDVEAAVEALRAGRTDEAAALATAAHARASGPREAVLALLALAEVPGRARYALVSAHEVADACGDPNLVTAVARAAKAAGVEFPPYVF